jgi:hypothetical protein
MGHKYSDRGIMPGEMKAGEAYKVSTLEKECWAFVEEIKKGHAFGTLVCKTETPDKIDYFKHTDIYSSVVSLTRGIAGFHMEEIEDYEYRELIEAVFRANVVKIS